MKNWGQQRKELDTHNIWHEEQLQRAKGSKIPLQREFSEGLRIWHPNTDLDDKKKKKQVFKRLYKRASQVQELLVRSRAGIQSPSLDSNQRGPPHSKLPIESVLGPSPAVTYFMVFLKVFGHILWSRCVPLSHSTCTANDSSNMD